MSVRFLRQDWEFNVLGAYNYRAPGPLRHYFDFVAENHTRIDGDVLEAGVFRGRSLMGMGLLLKELGSNKRVYGYDTWSGFPPIYHERDEPAEWGRLRDQGTITGEHYAEVQRNLEYRAFGLRRHGAAAVTAGNVSLSGDFSHCTREEVQAKLDFLGLDNVILVQGPFSDTMMDRVAPTDRLMAALIDADLYLSYRSALPFIWPRLSRGGYLFLDEYYSLKFPGARVATDEFFADKVDRPQCHKREPGDFERWYVRKLE